MPSARKCVACSILLGALAGCQSATDPREVKLSDAAIISDQAMATRQWETSSAQYPSGISPSYPTLFPYVADRSLSGPETIVLNPAIFFAQVVMLPASFFMAPAWKMDDTRGIYTPPTYTAVPDVAPDAQAWHEYSSLGVFAPRISSR